MAWIDSMRLRRRADKLRAIGWINLLLTVVLSLVHVSDGIQVLTAGVIWAALVMALTHGAAWALDKRAERVVTR
jgi:hypothetical protein